MCCICYEGCMAEKQLTFARQDSLKEPKDCRTSYASSAHPKLHWLLSSYGSTGEAAEFCADRNDIGPMLSYAPALQEHQLTLTKTSCRYRYDIMIAYAWLQRAPVPKSTYQLLALAPCCFKVRLSLMTNCKALRR